jgi:hypothetical protein
VRVAAYARLLLWAHQNTNRVAQGWRRRDNGAKIAPSERLRVNWGPRQAETSSHTAKTHSGHGPSARAGLNHINVARRRNTRQLETGFYEEV